MCCACVCCVCVLCRIVCSSHVCCVLRAATPVIVLCLRSSRVVFNVFSTGGSSASFLPLYMFARCAALTFICHFVLCSSFVWGHWAKTGRAGREKDREQTGAIIRFECSTACLSLLRLLCESIQFRSMHGLVPAREEESSDKAQRAVVTKTSDSFLCSNLAPEYITQGRLGAPIYSSAHTQARKKVRSSCRLRGYDGGGRARVLLPPTHPHTHRRQEGWAHRRLSGEGEDRQARGFLRTGRIKQTHTPPRTLALSAGAAALPAAAASLWTAPCCADAMSPYLPCAAGVLTARS
jgi:hypothetical protein